MMPSLVSLVDKRLRTIKASPFHDALVLKLEDHALDQAAAIDKALATKEQPMPLAGLTFVVKDNINVKDYCSQVGSPNLAWTPAESDSWVVHQLKSYGAILLGKTHMNEFAAGLDGRNVHYPQLLNPVYKNRLTGGSSSGSAVAVAAGLADFAIGTDTGGSVRIPACWNGVWGLRLSTDIEQLQGVFPRSPSLDALGILSQSAQCVFNVAKKLTWANLANKPLVIGYDPESLEPMSDPSKKRFMDVIKALSSDCPVKTVNLSALLDSSDKITRLLKAEFHEAYASAFPSSKTLSRVGPIVRTELKSSKMAPEDILKLQEELVQLRHHVLAELTKAVTFLVTPLCLQEAPEWTDTSERNDRFYTVALSLLGCPILGVPYPGVADGCQIASLDGFDPSLESLISSTFESRRS
jgi:aspartyl-tRNA(Asn)/glutamyl-tRNA(Gln) amidotransferase subunit A